MNATQKIVRGIGLAILAVMILFPPWKISYSSSPENKPDSERIGFHSLWYRYEQSEDETRTNIQQRIDLVPFAVELGIALLLTNGALLLFKERMKQH